MLVSDLGGVKWLWPFMHVIEAQERHDKSPKKGQVAKPDAAPRGDSSYAVVNLTVV